MDIVSKAIVHTKYQGEGEAIAGQRTEEKERGLCLVRRSPINNAGINLLFVYLKSRRNAGENDTARRRRRRNIRTNERMGVQLVQAQHSHETLEGDE